MIVKSFGVSLAGPPLCYIDFAKVREGLFSDPSVFRRVGWGPFLDPYRFGPKYQSRNQSVLESPSKAPKRQRRDQSVLGHVQTHKKT